MDERGALLASLLEGDLHDVAASGEAGLAESMAAAHAGTTIDEFSRTGTDWLATARHPKTGRRLTESVHHVDVSTIRGEKLATRRATETERVADVTTDPGRISG